MRLTDRAHQAVVLRFLYLYENYLLPRYANKHRPSLLQLKRQEFEDRKRLLNPYQKELVLHDDQVGLLRPTSNVFEESKAISEKDREAIR